MNNAKGLLKVSENVGLLNDCNVIFSYQLLKYILGYLLYKAKILTDKICWTCSFLPFWWEVQLQAGQLCSLVH